MAAPATKRRKIEHIGSNEEGLDAASFASFSDSADDIENEESPEAGYDNLSVEGETSEDEDGLDFEDRPQSSQHEGREHANPSATAVAQQRPSNIARKPMLDSATYSNGTFKSNMFKMQVEDLLQQIRQRHGTKEAAAEEALHKLKSTIEKIAAREPLAVDEAERQLLMSSKVVVPFPNPRPPRDAKYKLEYARPSNINVIGSYVLKTASRARRTVEIDMTVAMPSALFQQKDYLNYRYFYKRVYYLACIAAGLREVHADEFDIHFESFHDNHLKPILTVSPRKVQEVAEDESRVPRWRVRIIPSIPPDTFAVDKLLPNKNGVRPSPSDAKTTENRNGQTQTLTPFYNSSLRSDMLMSSYLKVLHLASKKCAAFQDACLLGSTWLRQRGLASNINGGGFGNFELSTLMALLLEGGGPGGRSILSDGYSSYQLLKATLKVLATKDGNKQPLFISASDIDFPRSSYDGPLIWDSVRHHNLLFKMTPWSYKLLRNEAKTTLDMLADEKFDGFEAAFILRTDSPLYRYDYTATLDAAFVRSDAIQQTRYPLGECRKLYDVLQTGLGDRISLIAILTQRSEPWDIGIAGPSRALSKELVLGIVVNPSTIHRSVDHGPSAEEKSEAVAFRKFWGEKAELRRFKDGSILESLVWTGKESGQPVFEQIVRYVISRHLGEEAERNLNLTGNNFTRLLAQTSSSSGFEPLLEAYKRLETDLRALDNLPLSIRQMMPSDAQFRSTSIMLPQSSENRVPANVVLQFEGSSRWPDDLIAIQRTKIAFLLNISEQLQGSGSMLTSRIGLENEDHDVLNQAFLDIIYDSGAAFRIRVHYEREQSLLERKLKDKTSDQAAKELTALALAKYKRDYIKVPALTQAIARLCQRYPALSGTIRLAKKWFASHLLSNHIAEEFVETLVARTFVQPWPWDTPASVQTGFLRTLFWLSRWDWRNDPLVVDLSNGSELKQPQMQTIRSNFEAWRKLDPGLNRVVLFCGSNIDPDGTSWTDGRTPKVVAARMTALAKAACAAAELQQLKDEPASIFSSSLSDFDFAIHLNPSPAGKRSLRKQATPDGTTFKNLEMAVSNDPTALGYQPMEEFLTELENVYSTCILFFAGGRTNPVIAGLWVPHTAPRAWKLNLSYSTVPKSTPGQDEIQAEINKDAVLAEIARLGGDLVERIETRG